jgi:N utilization substance protein A
MAVDHSFWLKKIEKLDELYVLCSEYTHHPFVVCDEETFDDMAYIFTTAEMCRAFAQQFITDKYVLHEVQIEKEMIPGEYYRRGDRIKLYVVEVKKSQKGFRIVVSRTHPDLVKRLFEREVTEIAEGVVEIRSISREAGSRSKIAVWSNDENVDAVGSCVGMNGARVNAIVDDLYGEKIDIIEWDPDPAVFIEHALSPSKVVSVTLGPDGRSALVVVPDYQLSLAIGKEGQNARLAAKLTKFKIDIKSETQAKDAVGFRYEDYLDDGEEEYYEDGEYTEEYEEGEAVETADESSEE